MDVGRRVANQPADDISGGVNILAHGPVRPLWPVGASKPHGDIGLVRLRRIDVGRDFSYLGINSSTGGSHQSFERPACQNPLCHRKIARSVNSVTVTPNEGLHMNGVAIPVSGHIDLLQQAQRCALLPGGTENSYLTSSRLKIALHGFVRAGIEFAELDSRAGCCNARHLGRQAIRQSALGGRQ